MHDILDLHEFFVEGGDQKKSHVLLHISEPSTPEEKKKGYFFALSEVNRGNLEQIKHLQDIIDDIESRYFASTNTDENHDAFEEAIEHANRRGHHVLDSNDADVHCFIGILRGNTLAFSYHGKPQVALIYKKQEDSIYMDIIGEAEPDNAHLFSQLLQGTVNRGDTIYIGTPNASDLFPGHRLQKLIASRSTKETADHIEKVLSALRNGNSFGGILFKIISPNEAPRTGKQPKYIAPVQPQNPIPRDEVKQARRITEKDEPSTAQFILTGLGRALLSGLVALFLFLKKFIFGLGLLIIKLFILATNKGGQRQIVLADLKQNIENKKRYLLELPIMSKILLLLAALSAFGFLASALYIKHQKTVVIENERNQNLVQAVKDKKDAADASVIYGDSGKALSLLNEAMSILNQLPKSQPEKATLTQSIESDIATVTQSVQKWINIKSELLADLSKIQASAKTEKIVMIVDTILAYGPNDTTAYLLNTNTKKVETKTHERFPSLIAANTPKEQDQILFISGPQKITAFDQKTQTFASTDIGFNDATTSIKDLFGYNQRLYTLDPKTNQIYKHAKIQTGYDKGAAWIKSSDVNLRDAVSLAIDGDMFVLKNDGSVLKFTSGESQPFSLAGLTPALEHPELIWTYNNVNNLYILESAHKRVVVTDKNGKLIGQYTDPAWINPTSIIVNEEKKIAYILDQNKLYKFGL